MIGAKETYFMSKRDLRSTAIHVFGMQVYAHFNQALCQPVCVGLL